MLKDLVPSTNDTFPTFIYRRLNTLGSNPTKSDLDFINELINQSVQEERVVPHEEVQEWKKLEAKVLNDQNTYRKETKNMKKTEKYLIRFSLSLLLFCWKILPYITEDENPEDPMILLVSWPIDFIAVAIYLFCLYGFNLGTSKSVQHQVLENEDDDDWEESMTSTELLSIQKVLVNRWNKLEKERTEQLGSDFLLDFALYMNMVFFGSRVYVIHLSTDESSLFFSFSFLTEPESIFLFVEYILSVVIFAFFFFQYLEEHKKRHRNGLEKLCIIAASYYFDKKVFSK